MKQTAVEWLVSKLHYILAGGDVINGIIKQAKEMEAEQSKIPELSDDEIEKESWGYREATKDIDIPPNEDWYNGAKWYREQLKQRQ